MSTKTEQLQAMITPAVEALGYEMWGVEFQSHGRPPLLRVFIDSEKGINVDDCAAASRQISAVLDVEDPISTEYTLEVSSPGMDRPLFTLEQFSRYIGEWAKIKLRAPYDGRRNFRGRLNAVENDEIVVQVDDHEYLLPLELVEKANVVPQFTTDKSAIDKSAASKKGGGEKDAPEDAQTEGGDAKDIDDSAVEE